MPLAVVGSGRKRELVVGTILTVVDEDDDGDGSSVGFANRACHAVTDWLVRPWPLSDGEGENGNSPSLPYICHNRTQPPMRTPRTREHLIIRYAESLNNQHLLVVSGAGQRSTLSLVLILVIRPR